MNTDQILREIENRISAYQHAAVCYSEQTKFDHSEAIKRLAAKRAALIDLQKWIKENSAC